MFESASRSSEDKTGSLVLTDSSPQVRIRAAGELGRKGDPASIDLLRRALVDSDPAVRQAVAEALRDAGDKGKVAESDLVLALQAETNPSAAVAMGWALQRWKSDLRPGLDTFLKVISQKDDVRSRYHAALLIRNLVGVDMVAPVYVDTLGTQVAKDARNKPQELLSDLIPEHANTILPLLAAGAKSGHPDARVEIARLLHHFKPKTDPREIARRLREDPNADVYSSVLPPEAEITLLALLGDEAPEVRAAAAWSAGMCSPAPLATGPLLLAALADTDESVRAAAVLSLGPLVALKRAPRGALKGMEALIDDPSAKVRADTALAIAHLGKLNADTTRKLAARVDAEIEPDANARAMAASALGGGADVPELKAAIVRGLRDSDTSVVERTLSSIGQLQFADKNVLNTVAELTRSESSFGIRLVAIGALSSLGSKASPVYDALVTASVDPDDNIRAAAEFALERIRE